MPCLKIHHTPVLIVAKCIVNMDYIHIINDSQAVLIVAKCIVNFVIADFSAIEARGINSSKVYCKY